MTVGESSDCPHGKKDVVYVRAPGKVEWKAIGEAVQQVSTKRQC